MACLYKRRKQYRIGYYIEGKQIQKSLHTSNEMVALAKKKQVEYQLSLGELHAASQLHVPEILEAFCKHITATRTYKSYKNISRLRTFFGPVCESLKPCPPGIKRSPKSSRIVKDKYTGAHIQATYLEDISPEVINRFLSDRIKLNAWAPKIANLM